jgi:peptide/nickel transport system substrate-binding protein
MARRGVLAFGAAGLLFLLAVVAPGCGGDKPGDATAPSGISLDAEQPKRGGTLRVAVVKDHTTFDPPVVLAISDILFTQQAYDNLVLRDPENLRPIPMLAESWKPNDDLTQYTFHLRPGVKFHHGKEFTAEDVVFTFNRLLDPDTGSPIAAILDFVAEVVAIDELTVRFDLKSPNTYLPDLVSLYHARILPSDVDVERLATEEFGTGPFILKEHVPGERIVMVRNPDYWWKGYPYLDEIIVFYISDPSTRAKALMSGAVDVIQDLIASNVLALEAHAETRVSESGSAAYLNLAMDMSVEPFDNVLVRKALQAATDRESILRAAQFGKGEIAYDHPVPPSDPHFWEGSYDAVPPYDPELARSLLAQAGYPDGIDLTLFTSTSAAAMVEMAVAFKDGAAPAGIRVDIRRESEERYWSDVWMVEPFTTVSWGGRTPDEAFSVAYKSDAKWNESRFSNPRVDELIVNARSQVDLAKRKESYAEIQRILIDEVPRIIPVFGPAFHGLRINVRDCEANPLKARLLLYRCWLAE